MPKKTKADTRPASSINISHNIKNNKKNQAVIPFNPAKITEILRDKLNIEVSSPKIRTEKFERPKENPSVYYKVFDNGNGNYIFHGGDFATGEQFTEYLNEKGDIRGKTNEDNKIIKQATRKAEEERDKYYEETARKNAYILQKSNKPIPDDFAYCLKKGLNGSDFNAFQSIGYNPKYNNIVMPLFDIFDKHWANQYIYPDKITLPNGEKTDKIIKGKMGGCFNVAGDIENSDIVYFAEGAVTALIVHLATGKPCVFGVNAGNIEPVFLAFKGKFQDKKLILIADNDLKKEAEKGINKGRETAEKLNSKYSLPYILSPVHSDFNDYYKGFIDEGHTRKQALSKVKEYILNPDNIVEANETPEHQIEPNKNNSLPEGFYREDGLIKFDGDKGQANVCSDLNVLAFTMTDKKNYGVYLTFEDTRGNKKPCIIDRGLLASRKEIHSLFLDKGIKRIFNPSLFRQLLESSSPSKVIQVSDKTGWNKDKTAYIFTDETLCKAGTTEDIIYKYKFDSEYETSGTFQSWRDNVCKYSNDNPVLIFAFSVVFSGALSSYLDCAGIGSHFYGDSSAGKTTTALMAASLLNGGESFQSWRVTNNGFEGIAAKNNHSCLIFDDISEVAPDDLDKIIYMAINGNGKQRATKTGTAADLSKWQINLISTGEFSASDYLLTGSRKKQNAGQALRLLDLPASDIGLNGCFDCKHDFEDFASFSDYLKVAAAKHYGFAFKGFVREILKHDKHELEKDMKETQDKLKEEVKKDFGDDIDNQTGRVIKSLSCVIIAGELATENKITTWNKGDAFKSCLKILKSWISFRGGFGNHEIKTALNALKEFIETKSSQHIEDTKEDLPFKGEKLAYYEDGFYFVSNKQIQPLANKLKTTKETLRKVLQQLSGKDTSQQYKLRNPKTGLKEKNNRYWRFDFNKINLD
jgi:putative DNA primase/helicase